LACFLYGQNAIPVFELRTQSRFAKAPPELAFHTLSRQAGSSSLRHRFSFPSCHLQEARFVVRVVGAHEAVPEIEVDAVVAAQFFVMHGVVCGGIDEKLQRSLDEPAGVKLLTGVTKDVVGDLPHHEDCEGERMDRN